MHTCNPSIWAANAGESAIQGHPGLEFKARLELVRQLRFPISKIWGTAKKGDAETLSSQGVSPQWGGRPHTHPCGSSPTTLTGLLCSSLWPWCSAARPEGGSGRCRRMERGSPSRSNEVISPEILKMRAALFCIFTYLDTRTLLHAAEVCRDWRFVARHPAVWTRVLLENARVCSKVPAPALLGALLCSAELAQD